MAYDNENNRKTIVYCLHAAGRHSNPAYRIKLRYSALYLYIAMCIQNENQTYEKLQTPDTVGYIYLLK